MPSRFGKNQWTPCPFFYRETSTEIKCRDTGERAGGAGLVGESTVTCFATKADKDEHKANFCNSMCQGCEIYHAFTDMIEYQNGGT